MYNTYLYHHGIKGQKWGVRRYQNEDGSYKSGAEGRYDPESSGGKSKGSDSKKPKSSVKECLSSAVKNIDKEKALKIGAVAAGTALVAIGAYKLNQSQTADIVNSLSQYGETWLNAAKQLDSAAEKIGTQNLSMEETQKWMDRSTDAMTRSGDASYAMMKYATKGGPSLGERRAYYKAKGGYNGAEALLKYRNDQALKRANSKKYQKEYAKMMAKYRKSWDT